MPAYLITDTPVVAPFLRALAQFLLRVWGWRTVGQVPHLQKYLVVGGPHTSYWDAVLGLAVAFSFRRFRVCWMAKHTVFRWPFRSLLSWLGGIPTNRTGPQKMVSQLIQEYRNSPRLAVAILPEGTRKRVEYWKSGFYHIARSAKLPVLCAFLDYPNKVGGFGPLIHLTGDPATDMARIAGFFRTKTGKHPERTGPIRLSCQATQSLRETA